MEAARKMFFKERRHFIIGNCILEAYILIFYRHIVGLFLNYSLFGAKLPEKIEGFWKC